MTDTSHNYAVPRSALRGVYAPMWLFIIYTLATFGLFTLGPLAAQVTNWPELVGFLASGLAAFSAGFAISAWLKRYSLGHRSPVPIDSFRRDRGILKSGIVWYLAFAFLSMATFGITTPAAFLAAIFNPQASYYAKFDEIAQGPNSTWVFQILNLTGALYFVLIPFTVLYWNRISRPVRTMAIIGVLAYMAFFLATGTQKGLGDVAIAVVSSLLALAIRSPSTIIRKARWLIAAAVVALVAIGVVIVSSFGSRTDGTSTLFNSTQLGDLVTQLTPTLGPNGARGIVVAASYATHGYLGLSYSLHLPFVWTGGLGAARGLSSYLPQYFGIPDPYFSTYPVRVEGAYSWSATNVWSTVYPWLASDLSFPGVILALFVGGMCVASIWLVFLTERSSLALVLSVMFAIFVVYSPANNQLFNDRYSALGTVTLVVAYIISRFRARHNSVATPHALVRQRY